MKVVFDTNVLISAFISKGTPYLLMKKAMEDKFSLIISPDIFEEFRNVINRKKFHLSNEQIEDATIILFRISEMVKPQKRVSVIEADPDDDRVLECALSSNADIIVSGDSHLLSLPVWEGIRIIKPSDALEYIE